MTVFRILAAVVALAAGSPALAQVPSTGPYSPVDGNKSYMMLIADGTLTRQGNVAGVTVIAIYSDAGQVESEGIARMDLSYEFRCGGTDYRTTGVWAYDTAGASLGGEMTASAWEAVAPDSPNTLVRAFACDGQATTPNPAPTLQAMQDFYRGWLAGDYD